MRLAAVVPVGYVDRMGYQHVWAECHGNWLGWADGVYVMPTIRGHPEGVAVQPATCCFARKPDGSPWFDAYRVMENVNQGVQRARQDGHDAAIVLMCNNYVMEPDLLRGAAEDMLAGWEPWAWYYRFDQLADRLFGPSVRLPWLVNLRHGCGLRFSMDSLVVEETEIVWMERGDFRPDAPPVVDVQLEMTVEDLADKMNFIRCYSDLVPKRKPVFEWDYWFPYYVKKFEAKRRAGAGGGATFSAIARKSRPEFVSHRVLECL